METQRVIYQVKWGMNSQITTIVSDTNVTHYFEMPLNKGFQRHSTIEWE